MRKFLCKSDINLMGKKLASVGDIVEENSILESEDGIIKLKLETSYLENKILFNEVNDIKIITKELDQNEEEMIKEWIIQIKVKTSRKNLRDIEDYLNKNLSNLL